MLKFFVLICNLLSLDCQDNGVVNGATASASNSTLSSNFTLIDSNSSSSIVSESIIDNNGYNQSYGHTGQSEAQNSTFPIAVDPLNSSLNSSNIAENIAASTNSTSTSTPPTTITTKPIFDDSIEELLDRLDTDNSTNSTSSKETTSSKFDPLIKCNEEPEPPMSTRSVDENEPIESTQIRKPDSTTTPATTTMASPRIVVDAKSTGIFNSTKSFARRRQSNASAFQYHLYGARQRKKCKKFTEQEKYIMLERIGGRNQQFMANSADEASRNFPKLLPSHNDPTNTRLYDGYSADDFDVTSPLVDQFVCDDTCQEIRRKLGYITISRTTGHYAPHGKRKFMGPLGDDHNADKSSSKENVNVTSTERSNNGGQTFNVSGMDEGRKSKGCSLEKFITIGNCTVRGDEEVLDHEKLCSACQGIFVMSSDCFPSFLNAVNCGKDDGRCIFDHFTGYAQGKCMSKTLSFKVMHNRGTKDCEEWEFVYIDIPVACECFLSKTSFLDTIPNEDSQ